MRQVFVAITPYGFTAILFAAFLLTASLADAQNGAVATTTRSARESDPRELIDAKAAHILGLLRFTSWPGERNSGTREVLVIGSRTLFSALRRQSRSSATLGHAPILVRRADPHRNHSEDLLRRSQSAHAIYIDSHAVQDPAPLLAALAGKPVLTIGDSPRFTEAGGMLKLMTVDAQLRFMVNTSAIDTSRLQISAKALALARPDQEPP